MMNQLKNTQCQICNIYYDKQKCQIDIKYKKIVRLVIMKSKAIDLNKGHLYPAKQQNVLETNNYQRDFRSCSPRIFKRSREVKVREVITVGKKRSQAKQFVQKMVCYVSLQNLMHSKDKMTSYNNKKQINTKPTVNKLQMKSRASTSPNLKQINEQNNQNVENCTLKQLNSKKLAASKYGDSIQDLKQEIIELKGINQIINKQLQILRNQKQCQVRITQDFQQKITQLIYKLKQSAKVIKNYEKDAIKVKRIMDENPQMSFRVDELSRSHHINQIVQMSDESSKQQFEKVVLDLNSYIDHFFPDSDLFHQIQEKIPNNCHITQDSRDRDAHEAVYDLHEKIKYLQIEVNMLKRYKVNYQKMEKQCVIYRSQVRAFKKRAVLIAQQNQAKKHGKRNSEKQGQKQQNGEMDDSSLSFELSKDSNPFSQHK